MLQKKGKQAGAEMCQALVKLWFGSAWLCSAWHGVGWLGMACGWFGTVLYTCKA